MADNEDLIGYMPESSVAGIYSAMMPESKNIQDAAKQIQKTEEKSSKDLLSKEGQYTESLKKEAEHAKNVPSTPNLPSFKQPQQEGIIPNIPWGKTDVVSWVQFAGKVMYSIAAIGSVMLAKDANVAMKSAASIVNGYRQNNAEKVMEAMNEYQSSTDRMLRQYEMEMKQFQSILNSDKLDAAQKFQQWQLTAKQYQHQLAMQSKSIKDMYQAEVAMKNAQTKAKQTNDNLNALNEKSLWGSAVQFRLTGTMPPGMGMGSKIREKIMSLGNKVDEQLGIDPNEMSKRTMEYQADQKALNDITKRGSQISINANTADQTLGYLNRSAKMLGMKGKLNLNIKSINDLEQAYQLRFKGDPEVVPYIEAWYEFINEYTKVVQGVTNNVAATDSARNEMMRRFSAANTPAAVEQITNSAGALMKVRLEQIDIQKQKILDKWDPKTSPYVSKKTDGTAKEPKQPTLPTNRHEAMMNGWEPEIGQVIQGKLRPVIYRAPRGTIFRDETGREVKNPIYYED